MVGMSPLAEEHSAKQRMDEADKLVAAIRDVRAKQAEENRRAYERFYTNLALFSGGTVALSVTFLGYLKTLSKPIAHQGWLVESWVAFFVCLAFSLFWTLFITHYGHFFRLREYAEAVKKKYETEANEIHHLNIADLRTPAEFDAYIGPLREAASRSGRNAESNKRREKLYLHVWVWSGRLARLSFLVGLGLLLLFATKNI